MLILEQENEPESTMISVMYIVVADSFSQVKSSD